MKAPDWSSLTGRRPRLGGALWLSCVAVCWLVVPACQVVFGDFTIDSTKLNVSCLRNVTRCNGPRIEVCVDGNQWNPVATCRSPALCNLTTLTCTECQPGSSQCSDAQPQVCGTDKTWHAKPSTPCASAALCQVPDDGSAANCQAPGCDNAGELKCVGDHLQRCAITLAGWEDIEICGSAVLCDAEAATKQVTDGGFPTCRIPLCNPGQFNCETGSPQPCNRARTGWDPAQVTCNGVCNVAKGDCSACTPGAFACSGSELSQCTGTAWSSIVACSSALSCSTAGTPPTCDPSQCTPGEFQCNESSLQRCRSDGGKWESVQQCQNGRLCNPKAARCEAPKCKGGATRCKGAEFQVCRDDLTGWDTKPPCSAGSSCDPKKGCVPGLCTNDTLRCNDVTLERCTDSVWQKVESCATAQLCDSVSARCVPPACTPGDKQCVDVILQTCKDDRTGWRELETCLRASSVCSAITKQCEPR